MSLTTCVIVVATIFAVFQILRSFGVFEFTKTPNKTVEDIKAERKYNSKRKKEQKKLVLYASFTNMFRGLLMSELQYEKHKYWIQRLELRSKVLNRMYTPEEYRGKYGLRMLVGIFCIPIGIFFKPAFLVTIITVGMFIMYPTALKQKIEDEDKIIDNNFLNLYLLLYSRLKMGSRARLQSVVESYIETMSNERDVNVKNTMLKLARYMLNNLSQYEDHVAIPKLRDRYNSATIINFCNVASQALQGVNNADNLLAFKMQLVDRKTTAMEKRSEKIYAWGLRSIYLIWVILFFFVMVGFYAKLPTNVL